MIAVARKGGSLVQRTGRRKQRKSGYFTKTIRLGDNKVEPKNACSYTHPGLSLFYFGKPSINKKRGGHILKSNDLKENFELNERLKC